MPYTLTFTVQSITSNPDASDTEHPQYAVLHFESATPTIQGFDAGNLGVPLAVSDVASYLPGATVTYTLTKV